MLHEIISFFNNLSQKSFNTLENVYVSNKLYSFKLFIFSSQNYTSQNMIPDADKKCVVAKNDCKLQDCCNLLSLSNFTFKGLDNLEIKNGKTVSTINQIFNISCICAFWKVHPMLRPILASTICFNISRRLCFNRVISMQCLFLQKE